MPASQKKTYQSWKEKIIEEKVANLTNRKMVVCSYMLAGMGDYKETMPLDEVESFKEWIDQNGSAFFYGYEDAALEDIRNFVSLHIADGLIESKNRDSE